MPSVSRYFEKIDFWPILTPCKPTFLSKKWGPPWAQCGVGPWGHIHDLGPSWYFIFVCYMPPLKSHQFRDILKKSIFSPILTPCRPPFFDPKMGSSRGLVGSGPQGSYQWFSHFWSKKGHLHGGKNGSKIRIFQNISKLMGLQRTHITDKNEVLGRP